MCRGNLGVGILSLINSKTAHAIPEAAFRVNQGDAILWEDICKVDGGDWILLPRHLRRRVTLFQEPSSEIRREKQSFPFLWEDICKVDGGDWILLPRHLWRRVTLFREPSSEIRREKQSFPASEKTSVKLVKVIGSFSHYTFEDGSRYSRSHLQRCVGRSNPFPSSEKTSVKLVKVMVIQGENTIINSKMPSGIEGYRWFMLFQEASLELMKEMQSSLIYL